MDYTFLANRTFLIKLKNRPQPIFSETCKSEFLSHTRPCRDPSYKLAVMLTRKVTVAVGGSAFIGKRFLYRICPGVPSDRQLPAESRAHSYDRDNK